MYLITKQPDRPRSLILVGVSRLGKTEWARSLGPHMYWNGYFDLSLWNDDADYAIFDDISTDNFKQYKQWLGAQRQFTATDKYMRKRQLLWGKPCIFLANQIPDFDDRDWINANCSIVQLRNPLF